MPPSRLLQQTEAAVSVSRGLKVLSAAAAAERGSFGAIPRNHSRQKGSCVVAVGRVVIVGAGPAGAALAYLLARRGVGVTLLERHPDFEHTFRGEPPRTSSGETVSFRRL